MLDGERVLDRERCFIERGILQVLNRERIA